MIDKKEFETKALSLIAEAVPAKFKKSDMTPDLRLQRDLGLDSIGMLALMFRFEQTFGLDLATIDVGANLGQMRTVADALAVSYEIYESSQTDGETR